MSVDVGDARCRAVLRMRARAGCEQAIEDTWRTVAQDISRLPGNLRQELVRDVADPQTFLIVSDWADPAALDAFGRSPARGRLTAALCDLRESAEGRTYEVLHSVAARGPRVRVVVTVTVAAGEEAAYERAYLKVAERMRGTPGHVREELLREPGTSTYHLFAEWEDEDTFTAWVEDPAHMDSTAPMLPYLLESFERKTYHIVARPETTPLAGGASGPAAPVATPSVAVDNRAVPRSPAGSAVRKGGSTMHTSTDVLVIGAGPVGLTLAIELARRGIACRVIDKRAEPADQADKAIGVHCRTMEIWENIGVVREAMDAGIWLHGQTVFVNGKQTHQVDWDLPDLPYAHLGLPQYETERILTDRLRQHGVVIERGLELDDFVQGDQTVTARLLRAPGDAETVRARYLVGCDGAHSRVREHLGLSFEGGMGVFPQLFMLGDVDLDWSMPEGHLLRFVELDDGELRGMLVCVPLRGRGRYRVATLAPPRLQAEIGTGVVPPGFWKEYTPPVLGDIQAVLDRLAPAGTTASNLRWSSIFRIKHGIVDRYRVGQVFVAGDAAHLHPPAGGQGMNTGIQDAWNLGWKLALAVRGRAAPGLLDSYEAERRPAGKAIVDRAVRIAFTDEMDMEDEREQFLTEMQMRLTYAGSPVVAEAPGSAECIVAGPGAGDRAPDVSGLRRVGIGHALRLFDLTQGTGHTLLLYADASAGEEEVLAFEKLAAKVRGNHPDLLRTYVVASPDAVLPAAFELPVIRDDDNAFRVAYGVRGAAAYLVRPDGHVGFRCSPISGTALDEHLDTIFAA